MAQGRRFGVAACALLILPGAALAEEEYRVRWSTSLEAALHHIASQEADDDVTGFFDQYRFTPNKGSALPAELAVTDADVDVLGEGDTPVLRFRLDSPTSNLGISGADPPFLNQRALLFGRASGLSSVLRYRRLRTEDLRRFPDPTGSPLSFTDLTGADDRFYKERTGFDARLRLRPQEASERAPVFLDSVGAEIEVRGGYEHREGERQRRFLLDPGNDWLSLDQDLDQDVGAVGGGVLLAPGGLFTLTLDVDHERFREDESFTDADLGAPFPSTSRPIGFVPDTDRTTGAVQLRSRIGERVDVRGAYQVALLEQVEDETFEQTTAGLDDNYVLFSSANAAVDVLIVGGLSANAFFDYDERDNRIDRDTPLFNAAGGGQVDGFLDSLRRIATGGELVYAFHGANRVSVGVEAEWVDRDLDFVTNPAALRVLPANASVSDETRTWTVFGRTRVRPLRGLDVRGEIGYRDAPETGYAVELDDYVYGKADVSYVVPLERPVVLQGFARGGSGENREFDATGGLGPTPAGASVDRDFERTEIFWGLSATVAPWERVTLFSTFFQARDAQDYDLVLSDQPRYFQDAVPLTFTEDGPIDYRSDDLGLIFGANVRFDERTDGGLSYTWNRIKTRYRTGGSASGGVETIEDRSRIDADIHRIALRVGRDLREGLRVTAGYRFDLFDDRSPVDGAGVVAPFDLDTFHHTVTFGVTLSSGLFD